MRQKRAKAYRKLMHVYSMSFGFRQPYQVLVDSKMCLEAVSSKMDLAKQLAVVLQGTVKPMITQCSIHSLYVAGHDARPAVDLAKSFERRLCNHREAKPEDECVAEMIGATNKHRYVLAAQSGSLRQYARQVPGTPIVHVKRSVMVLEPVSESTEKVKSMTEANRLRPSEAEASNIVSTLAGSAATQESAPPKKRRGPKGPNPLSVKKKKPKENNIRGRPEKQKEFAVEEPPNAGEKRKHDENDEYDIHQQNGLEKNQLEAKRLGRRRKRARKRRRLDEPESKNEIGDSSRKK